MKVKLVQDSIIFVSSLKKEALLEAQRFVPQACTLLAKDEETKKTTPICSIAYMTNGGISDNGVVFDSVTEDGYMCKTLVATAGEDPALSTEEKVKLVSERYAGLILKMNDLEAQIKEALNDNAAKIATARESIEAVNI